jgi:hypothetical protein
VGTLDEGNRCASCNKPFRARAQSPRQAYCKDVQCQRTRRRRWQQAKRLADPDYKYNQRNAQRAWAKRNPDYWSEYRRTHPEYRERNRVQQLARGRSATGALFAKIYSSQLGTALTPGIYRVTPARGEIAKMNLSGVEISWVSALIGLFRQRCKERTP